MDLGENSAVMGVEAERQEGGSRGKERDGFVRKSEVTEVGFAGSKHSRGKRVEFLRRAHLRDSSGASKSVFFFF